MPSVKKKIRRHLANRPTYEISEEYQTNINLAQKLATGRSKSFLFAEQNIRQGAAQSVENLTNITGDVGSILQTLGAINSRKNEAYRNLYADESRLEDTRVDRLIETQKDLAEEKDKAFEYNVNTPYQLRLQELRERRKSRQELVGTIIGGVAQIGGALAGGLLAGGVAGKAAGSAVAAS